MKSYFEVSFNESDDITDVVLTTFNIILEYVKTHPNDLFYESCNKVFYNIISKVLIKTRNKDIIKPITIHSRKILREIQRIDCKRERIGNDDRRLYGG